MCNILYVVQLIDPHISVYYHTDQSINHKPEYLKCF